MNIKIFSLGCIILFTIHFSIAQENKALKNVPSDNEIFGHKLILKNVSPTFKQKITIPACDGTQTIVHSKDVFTISNIFTILELEELEDIINPAYIKTGETTVVLSEPIEKDVDLVKMFKSISNNIDTLFLTQSQIVTFCKIHSNLLYQNKTPIMFLFTDNNKFFFAIAFIKSGVLDVVIQKFEYINAWRLNVPIRVVVPQLNM
jgi:hypothetical protein